MNSEIVMYQTEDGLTKIETTFDNDSVWVEFAYTASDGKEYQADYYNLDVIISVILYGQGL